MKRWIVTLVAFSLFLASLSVANASVGGIAYDNQAGIPDYSSNAANYSNNLQNWLGSLGLDFQVNQAITVNALGVFDNGDPLNLIGADSASGVTVAIYNFNNTSTPVVGSILFTPGSVSSPGFQQINGDAFLAIAPVVLQPGTYSVVTFNDRNFNQGFINDIYNLTSTENTFGGAIAFVGSGRYYGGSSIGFPTTPDAGPTNRYDAGTFSVVPEPTTLAIWGLLGVAGAAALRRRKQPRGRWSQENRQAVIQIIESKR